MGVTCQIEVAVPIDLVFRYINEDHLIQKWMDGFVENIYFHHPTGGSRRGTTFVQRVREGRRIQEYDGEIIAYDSPSFLGLRLQNEIFTMDVYYRLIETDYGGTILHYECLPVFHHWYTKMLSPFFQLTMKGVVKKQLAILSLFLEEEKTTFAIESEI